MHLSWRRRWPKHLERTISTQKSPLFSRKLHDAIWKILSTTAVMNSWNRTTNIVVDTSSSPNQCHITSWTVVDFLGFACSNNALGSCCMALDFHNDQGSVHLKPLYRLILKRAQYFFNEDIGTGCRCRNIVRWEVEAPSMGDLQETNTIQRPHPWKHCPFHAGRGHRFGFISFGVVLSTTLNHHYITGS